MRALIQRVTQATVTIDGKVYGAIGAGLVIFVGVTHTDTIDDALYLAQRSSSLRIFEDQEGKMNRSIKETEGSALVVSQFTLYADSRKGNRPSFVDAARPEVAEEVYSQFVDHLRKELGAGKIATGMFRAMMDINLTNNGPVTIILESKEKGHVPHDR